MLALLAFLNVASVSNLLRRREGLSAATILLFVGLLNAVSRSNLLRKFGGVLDEIYIGYRPGYHWFKSCYL